MAIELKEANKQIVKRELKKHFLSTESDRKLTNDGCQKYEAFVAKIQEGTMNQLYRVGALKRQHF